ncbi:MAG: DNA-3-methyladenine glycosylase I [Bacteroidetes bacterium]|nr:DNA-3-methyladenine glycosylase I [Bacteroidota bacterium]
MQNLQTSISRCPWPSNDPLMIEYHDNEWGVVVHDDRMHFEFIVLDCFQAGLRWKTVLHKRANFRKAFDDFDYHKIALYDQAKIGELLQDSGIIRNKAKIHATIRNANLFLEAQKEYGSFDSYIWQFTCGKTIRNRWEKLTEIPITTKESDAMSKDLIKRGFKFVGSTICYSYMQAAGMVNDHMVGCYRYGESGH